MNFRKICVLFVSVALLNGCAIFKVGDLPQAQLSSVRPSTPKPTISYNLRVKSDMGSERDYPPKAQTKANKELGEFLRGTRYFRQVSPYNKNADIQLRMQMIERSSPLAPIGSFITGYSFFTIPSWTTIHYELTATARGENRSKTYRMEDTARMFMWLPLVVASPFYNISTITDMQENMYLTVVQQMQRDGLLVKRKPIVPVSKTQATEAPEKDPAAKSEQLSPAS